MNPPWLLAQTQATEWAAMVPKELWERQAADSCSRLPTTRHFASTLVGSLADLRWGRPSSIQSRGQN